MNTIPDDAPAGGLDPEIDPPPHLKRRVERSLRARGLLASRAPDRMPAWLRTAGAVAAALLLVSAGFWLGALAGGGAGEPAGDTATHYVLLLYEDEDFRPSADEAALVAEYRGWAGAVSRRGVTITGEKLDDPGTLFEAPGADGLPLRDGDHGSPLGRLSGYFVVSVADRAEALAIAGTCPHLRHGGRVVLRQLVPT
jgi:hypothetical protein